MGIFAPAFPTLMLLFEAFKSEPYLLVPLKKSSAVTPILVNGRIGF